ncbi:MFS transporter [bacterium]|nr:MFS transporter [bacterium]
MAKEKESLSIVQKAFWGIGGFAENLANNAFLTLSYPIFGVGMGISPFYIGLALSASRIIDAVTDPLMGNITDNTKSRWGRRRPWIFLGAILMSLTFMGVWYTTQLEKGFSVDANTAGLWHFNGEAEHKHIAVDSGPFQNHGSMKNFIWENAGKFKKALKFTEEDGGVGIRSPFSGLQNTFTVEMYAKSDSFVTGSALFNHRGQNSEVSIRVPERNRIVFSIKDSAGETQELRIDTTLATGVWNHIAAVYNGTQMGLYLNGEQKAVKDIVMDVPWDGTDSSTEIGTSINDDTSTRYSGLIDEVRISDIGRYTADFSLVNIWTPLYLIIMVSLFYMAFTMWVVPYSGLGLELAVDYNERTQLMIFRVLPSFIVGIAIASLYKITLMDQLWGGNEVTGAFYVGAIVAAFMLITAITPAILCRERYAHTRQKKLNMFKAIVQTLEEKPFLLLIGSVFFVFVALFFMIPLLTYISLYYVCQGSKDLMATVGMYTGFVQAGTQILSMFVIGYFAKFFDKKKVLIAGLTVGIIGYLSSWFLFTPESPYLTIIPPVVINIGLCACWVLNGSFSADICDLDELKTGGRREGMYSAVFGFLNKLAIAVVSGVSAWVLVKLGFEGEDLNPTAQQLFTLRWFYIVIPVVAMIGAIICMWKYPLTRERVREIQEKLKQIRGETSLQS